MCKCFQGSMRVTSVWPGYYAHQRACINNNNRHHQSDICAPTLSIKAPRTLSSLSAVLDDEQLLSIVKEGVADKGGAEAWEESVAELSSSSSSSSSTIDATEAENLLADAFGWKSWAKASERFRKYQNPKLPDAVQLRETLAWLREGPLELGDDQLVRAIREKPKAYLDAPHETYEKVSSSAPAEYKDPAVLNAMIVDDPRVMECTYNCDIGDDGCASECGNCWVSYGISGR